MIMEDDFELPDFEDDPSLIPMRSNKPAGFFIDRDMEENRSRTPEHIIYDTYMEEKNDLYPTSHPCTAPDIEVRYTL